MIGSDIKHLWRHTRSHDPSTISARRTLKVRGHSSPPLRPTAPVPIKKSRLRAKKSKRGRVIFAWPKPLQSRSRVREQTCSALQVKRRNRKPRFGMRSLTSAYTNLVAPVSGIVGRKSMEVGQRVAANQLMLTLAPPKDVWAIANFRETQLKEMRIGQSATVHVDSIGRDFPRNCRKYRRGYRVQVLGDCRRQCNRQLCESRTAHPRAHSAEWT